MDSVNEKWFCDICNRKYSTNRKDNHLQTEVHKKNEDVLDVRRILKII